MKDFRVGLGFDVHRFSKKKKPLILGGVNIKCGFSLEAISDGDVVLHAISDAICGAGLLGDIGDYFPPSAIESKGLNSKNILQFILKKCGKSLKICNLDVTIVTDKPRLFPYKKKILKSLQEILNIKVINVKIKSKEGLNILGSKQAITCFAVVLGKKC